MKNKIDEIFEKADCQETALISLYKLVIPDWDKVKEVKGWPAISMNTWGYICEKFITLDKENHPEAWAGGLWFNKGFSSSETVDDWKFSLNNCTVLF